MFRNRIRSLGFAFEGLVFLLKTQTNARIHALATCAVVIAGVVCSLSLTQWCLITLSISSVLCAEAFNTGVECVTDLASPEHQPLAKSAKDVSAAAVLISSIGAMTVGVFVFAPKIYMLVL